MKFALLGNHSENLPLLRAMMAASEHRLICGADLGPSQLEIVKGPTFRLLSDWPELLVQDVDAVIVSGDSAFTIEGARQCAQSGLDVWVFPHAAHGVEFVYELALARDEHPIQLIPLFPQRYHPLIEKLREAVRTSAFGSGMFVQFERHLAGQPISLKDIDHALLKDVELLRTIFGDFEQVTAMRSGDGSPTGISLAQVTLAGNQAPQTTWSCQGKSPVANWKLTLFGEETTAILSGNDDPDIMTLEWNDTVTTNAETGRLMLEAVLAQEIPSPALSKPDGVEAENSGRAPASGIGDGPWEGLIRAAEIVDATHRSIRRRRTIDLYFEPPSERSNFKSQMTALGCAVLFFTLFAVLGLLTVGAVEKEVGVKFGFNVLGRRVEMMHFLRALVFVPITVFLLLQLLLPLTRAASPGRKGLT